MSTTRKRSFDDSEEEMRRTHKRIFHSGEDEALEVPSDDEEGDDDDDHDVILSTHRASWETSQGFYTVSIQVCENWECKEAEQVKATLFHGEGGGGEEYIIGNLEGNILSRPSYNFHLMGDQISTELQWLTTLFCSKRGSVSRVETNLEGDDIYDGGFLQIAFISIDEAHKGQDLGLRMIHEILVSLRGKWNIAVLSPGINSLRTSAQADNSGQQEDALIQMSVLKVARYFGRMGFRQAGRNADQCQAWFMTALTYFGPSTASTSSSSSAAAMRRWQTNDEIQTLDIYIPPEMHTPQGVDLELHNLVRESMDARPEEFRNIVRNISGLVRNQHASVHNSRAMFVIAADEGNEWNEFISTILRTLIMLSPGAINDYDENGNCPLHIAASAMNAVAIRDLLEAGANTTAQNDRGYTPLECIGTTRQENEDFMLTFGMRKHHPVSIDKFLDSTRLFMPDALREQLVDGWLPPRMLEMFLITASLAMDSIQVDVDDFENYRPKSIKDCCVRIVRKIPYFEYIPTDVFRRNPKGIYKSFVKGWQIVWKAIYKLLNRRVVPTISTVEEEIARMEYTQWDTSIDARKMRYFMDRGGRIEYALDALIGTTQKVYDQGDCYWMYGDFEKEIESHPETPLDSAFDLAKVKCLHINTQNFKLQPVGPYYHGSLCDDDE